MMSPGTHHVGSDRLDWPDVRLIGPRRFQLRADYVVEWQAEGYPRQRLIVPEGFECDGASIPAFLEWYLGRDNILPAAVPHDWQYAYGGRIPAESHLYQEADGEWVQTHHVWTRKESDRFFARNLRFCDIRDDQRRNAYRAVRLVGWWHWRYGRKSSLLAPA
jgi:hypothetical protein